ncbi:hypothetical protein GGE46_000995 [Rhizobium etli]|uniref:Uncharacterized protein n=1 Tax=Rhizobium etli TaxID=29449 RepID=A0A7W6V6B0_RHIET|nr:hypothetical protein [Rhizobium etli]MBB4534286.1 hypothetical protein [Rhizobium etli]
MTTRNEVTSPMNASLDDPLTARRGHSSVMVASSWNDLVNSASGAGLKDSDILSAIVEVADNIMSASGGSAGELNTMFETLKRKFQ